MPGRKGRAASNAASNRASSSGSWKKRGDALRVCVTRSAPNGPSEISRWVTDASWVGGRGRARDARSRAKAACSSRCRRAASAASAASCARLRLRSSSSGADEVSSARKRCALSARAARYPSRPALSAAPNTNPRLATPSPRSFICEARGVSARADASRCAPRRASPSSLRKSREAAFARFPDRRPHRGRGRRLARRAIARAARVSARSAAMRRVLRPRRPPRRSPEAARACSAMSRAGRCAPAWRFFAVSQLRGAFRAEDSRF